MSDYRDEYRKEWDAELRQAAKAIYPRAFCHNCGWEGQRREMLCGSNFLDGVCPECGSEHTELLPSQKPADACGASSLTRPQHSTQGK